MIPEYRKIQTLFSDEEKCIEYLMERNIIQIARLCPQCQKPMNLEMKNKRFRCGIKICKKTIPIRNDSYFERHSIQCSKILLIAYYWLSKMHTVSIKDCTKTSPKTVCYLQKLFQNIISNALDFEDTIIGGEGIIVEIDETKMGKRKFHRGHHVEGAWVLGGIEKTAEKKIFLIKVPDRSSNTLLEIITKHVRPGSIIYTDMWKAYNGISKHGYGHGTVNHSLIYKNPVTGVHTNTIEGIWNGLKMQIRPRNRNKECIDRHLSECIWRRKHKKDLWEGFLKALELY